MRIAKLTAAAIALAGAILGPSLKLGDTASEALATHLTIKRAESLPEKVLKVYNWEDYILPDMTAAEAEDNGYDRAAIDGLNTRFENYMLTQGENVTVVYDTFDTNETMLSQLKTGRIDYDLICPSDYTIQKMMDENLIIPFDNEEEYPGSTPYYDQYASPYLISKLESIKAYDRYHQGEEATYEAGHVQDFMRGYMWGTLGLVYNPDFHTYQERGISPEKIREDVQSWNILWDSDYRQTAYVKDSIRDTYAVLIIKAYLPEVEELKREYDAGTLSEEDYNAQLTEIFNRCDPDTLDLVAQSLRELTNNFYGYEVDNGKDDIQKDSTVGLLLSWSGDAVYSMNSADDAGNGVRLEYALPSEGANIWFDGWVMTTYARDHGLTDIAQAYVDFLSMPVSENPELYDMGPAVANMDYIGYTPFIADDQVFDYVRSSYDVRADEDGVIADPEALPEGEEGVDYVVKDLTYFFSSDPENEKYYIYADPAEANRQLDTMYPNEEQLAFLVVMADFGDNQDLVTRMWEANKAIQMPIWVYILFGVLVVGGLLLWGFFAYKHHVVRVRRRQRREANRAKLAQQQTSADTAKH